ncbi:MAG: hypothetical protein OXC99_06500 [Chloroflexi bacterium]|nr:hypothetical protein [Chloroflexota bacterium]
MGWFRESGLIAAGLVSAFWFAVAGVNYSGGRLPDAVHLAIVGIMYLLLLWVGIVCAVRLWAFFWRWKERRQ